MQLKPERFVEAKDASEFTLRVYNGRYKVYADGLVMLSWNQLDFQGYYAYKDDHSLFGITFYTKHTKIHCGFKTRAVWEGVLKLLDKTIRLKFSFQKQYHAMNSGRG